MPVATLGKPNDWGLFDVHGDVWEWVQDWYGDYPSSPVTDPKGPSSGSVRALWEYYDGLLKPMQNKIFNETATKYRN